MRVLLTEEEKRERKRACNLKWAAENPEKMLAYKKKSSLKHREKNLQKRRERYADDPGRGSESRGRWRKNNPDKANEKQRERYHKDPSKALRASRKWQLEHREEYLASRREKRRENAVVENERTKQWRNKNREHVRAYGNSYTSNRKKTDINFALRDTLRKRILAALKSNAKSGSTMKLLGCSIQDFRMYLESLFTEGMSWKNHGNGKNKWNIDHIIPCALFDMSKPEHQKRCFHFSNQQPLWQPDNLAKGKKLLSPQFNLL